MPVKLLLDVMAAVPSAKFCGGDWALLRLMPKLTIGKYDGLGDRDVLRRRVEVEPVRLHAEVVLQRHLGRLVHRQLQHRARCCRRLGRLLRGRRYAEDHRARDRQTPRGPSLPVRMPVPLLFTMASLQRRTRAGGDFDGYTSGLVSRPWDAAVPVSGRAAARRSQNAPDFPASPVRVQTMRRTPFLVLLVLAGSAWLTAQQKPVSTPAPAAMLTVDSIMRGPKLVGVPPSAVRWSKDSSKVYFTWQKAAEPRSSTFSVNRDGTGLKQLTPEEARTLDVPPTGRFDRARRRLLSAESGDIVLYDAATGARRFLTRTAAAKARRAGRAMTPR